MKTKNKILLFFSIVTMIACENNVPIIDDSDLLIGYWVNPVANDSTTTFERASSLLDNNYGFAFKSGQVFIERKNSGWCGTPPISYADFEGTWTKTGSIIDITVGYWGGLADYEWKIVAIDKNNLTIYKISEEYHNETSK